jgi:hypothetical protein
MPKLVSVVVANVADVNAMAVVDDMIVSIDKWVHVAMS